MKLYSILVVDDDPNMVRLIEHYLASKEFQLTTVSSGRKALHILANTEFDLLISDIQMPHMDGFKLAMEVRKTNSTMPLILASAFCDKDLTQRAEEAGANKVIQKPFERKKLRRIIKKILVED